MRNKENLLQLGWLILRAGIGISIMLHGIPKLTGGVETWTYIGGSMSIFGITFAPAFWGFLAAVAEAIGGALFALAFPSRCSNAYRYHGGGAGYSSGGRR